MVLRPGQDVDELRVESGLEFGQGVVSIASLRSGLSLSAKESQRGLGGSQRTQILVACALNLSPAERSGVC